MYIFIYIFGIIYIIQDLVGYKIGVQLTQQLVKIANLISSNECKVTYRLFQSIQHFSSLFLTIFLL